MSKFSDFQKKFRADYMPTGDELAHMAQEKLDVKKKSIVSNFNLYLKKLLDLEFNIYEQWEDKWSNNIIKE